MEKRKTFSEVNIVTTNNMQLTTEKILEKTFKKQVRGYNEVEVDEFLDMVIQDYEAFTQEIEQLKQENDRLKRSQGQQANRQQATGPTQVNYDVLKRLSNLEKKVFGQKRNEMEG